MIEYLKKNLLTEQYDKIKELSNLKNYPIYKDLDNYKKYDFDIINSIHQDLITIIGCVRDIVQENNIKIKEDKKQLNYGINIDNYIISHEFINNNLNSTNNLYESYLNVYHKYHSKLLTNYFEKINLFFDQINTNILDDTNSSDCLSPRKQEESNLIKTSDKNEFIIDTKNEIIDLNVKNESEINENLEENFDNIIFDNKTQLEENDNNEGFISVSKNKKRKNRKNRKNKNK